MAGAAGSRPDRAPRVEARLGEDGPAHDVMSYTHAQLIDDALAAYAAHRDD